MTTPPNKTIKTNKKNGNTTGNKKRGNGPIKKNGKKPTAYPPPNKQNVRKDAHITLSVQKEENAQGVRQNIMVLPDCVTGAVEAMPCAIIARGLLFGQNSVASPIYWAYYGFMKDIIAIMSNQVSPVTARLKYVTDIINSWQPKTVPFKTGTLSYGWKNVDAIQIPNLLTVRNYKTFFWVPDTTLYGLWLTQVPPSNPATDSEAFDKLAEVYTVVGNTKKPSLVFGKIVDKTPYTEDTSAFAACSLYYGAGNIAGVGASMSVENEVPFRSRILAGTNILDASEGRVARNFGLSSGDTTAAYGLPFMPGFHEKFYKTAYPIQYKFLDLDEVVYVLQAYYIKLVGLAVATRTGAYSSQTDFAFAPFPYSAQAFRIAIRQAVLSFFASTAPLTQFLNYSVDVNGFEPFRTGTNSMPENIPEIRMPQVLVENLRMLLNAYGFIPTKFQSKKNALMMIPVWGIYKSRANEPYNLSGTLYEEYGGGLNAITSDLFVGSGPDPNPIDGTGASGECVDLNSPLVNNIIQEWNERLSVLQAWSSPTGFLSGSSCTTLLTINRYCEYKEQVEVPLSKIPVYRRRLLDPAHIKTVRRTSKGPSMKTASNLISKATIVEEEELIFVPPAFSLFTQVTRAYASMQTITEEFRTILQYFIVPSIAITANTPPDQKAVRTHCLESNIWEFSTDSQDFFSAQSVRLMNYATILAPGVAGAGKTDELISLLQKMNDDSKGGFLGELLTGVASVLLPMIPI